VADQGLATNPEVQLFGIKLASAVAGFWGGVISLSFIKDLTPWQRVLTVLTGLFSAGYGTPLATHYLLSDKSVTALENAIAFVIGLTAMNIIPGLLRLSEMWRRNPWLFLNRTPGKSVNND